MTKNEHTTLFIGERFAGRLNLIKVINYSVYNNLFSNRFLCGDQFEEIDPGGLAGKIQPEFLFINQGNCPAEDDPA